MTDTPPFIRCIGLPPVADAEWTEVLDAVRRWRSYGAPYRAISDMVEDDYGVTLTPATIERLMGGHAPTRKGN